MVIDSEITASFGNISTSKSAVYTFTPAGFTTKLALVLPMLVVGVVGFIGNVLIVSFVSWKEKTLSRIESSRFVKTFNLFVRSLATVSDKNSWDTLTKRCFFPSRAPLVPLKVVYRGLVTKSCTPTLRGQGDPKVSQPF